MSADARRVQYPVIYADPPWGWSQSALVDRGSARTVEKEYGTLKAPRGQVPAEIMALPVLTVAAVDAVLFLWATGPKLPHALAVMAAWGFNLQDGGVYLGQGEPQDAEPVLGHGLLHPRQRRVLSCRCQG